MTSISSFTLRDFSHKKIVIKQVSNLFEKMVKQKNDATTHGKKHCADSAKFEQHNN